EATVNAPLSVTLSVTPADIVPGQQSTLTWSARGATSLTIDNGIGDVTTQTSHVVSPTQETTYTITAADAAGHTTTAAKTVTVSTSSGLQTIKHIIVMLQENRSFDSYFGQLQAYAASRGIANYQINSGYDPNRLMPLISGALAHPFHEPTQWTEDLTPAWNESHFDIDQQKDGTFK